MNRLYRVVKIEGKNLGCVAPKDIPKGTLILQERPQCIANWSDPEYTYLGVCSLISEYYLFITTLIFLIRCSKIINEKQLHQRINNFCMQFV